jgi:lipid II:glycine glycyltransferase (peptidoglycan interpeptide bridge formation enzyme)
MDVSMTDAVDAREWDAFVEDTAGGDLVQTTAWAATKRELGLGTRLVVVRRAGEGIVAGALLIVKRVAPLVSVGYVARGPLAASGDRSAAVAALDAAIGAARALGVRYLIVQPPESAGDLDAELVGRAFRPSAVNVAPDATVRLDLTLSEDELLTGMSTARPRSIRGARREGVEIVRGDDVELFHRLHTATAARQGFEPVSLDYLAVQWATLAPRRYVALFFAHHDGRVIAGLWLTVFGRTVTFKLPGWDVSAAGPKHVNEALHWGAITWARANGYSAYDFGGVRREVVELIRAGLTPAADVARGPDLFKLRFGGQAMLLPKAYSLITHHGARLFLGPLEPRLLQSSAARRAVHRARSG